MHDQIGEPGEEIGGGQAAAAANFAPNPFRLLWFACDLKSAQWPFFGGLGVIVFGLLYMNWRPQEFQMAMALSIAGGLIFLYALILIAVALLLFFKYRDIFQRGLLTAAVVDSLNPVALVHIAPLATSVQDEGECVYGVKRVEYNSFPAITVGTKLPCISGFQSPIEPLDTYYSFMSIPVMLGTKDEAKLAKCLSIVEGFSSFEVLRNFRKDFHIPRGTETTYVCDAAGKFIEERE